MSSKLDRILIIVGVIGIWALVLQNSGVFSSEAERVRVVNTVDVEGYLDLGTVDVNIQEINGKRNVFYQDSDGEYMLLPVIVR